MNEIFNYGSLLNNPLYNCSALTEEDDLLSKSIKRPLWGSCSLLYGLFAETCYLLCLSVMRKRALYQYACYKIMFILGCVDMISVFINNFVIAYCLAFGVDFCDMPNFLFITGCFHISCWALSCFFCLFLALNRIMEVIEVNRKTIDFFYSETSIKLATVFGFIYGSIFFCFTKPFVYVNQSASCLIDPHIYHDKPEWYRNDWLVFDDLVVVVMTSALYGFYILILCKRYKVISVETVQEITSISQRRLQKVFAQATVLCALNFFCAIIYPAFMFIPSLTFIPKTVMVAYQIATGLPAFVYLVMNPTIQVGVRDYFHRAVGKEPKDSHFTLTITQSAMTSHISHISEA